jgi:hypothetical protein
VIGLYGRADDASLLLVLSQFLLYLHLYLLEDLQLPLVRGRLLTSFAANIDVVADGFVGDGAGITKERPTVCQVGRACSNHLCQPIFHLFVGELGTLDAVVLLQEAPNSH